MKEAIKVLAIIALAAVIGFSFAACGDNNDNGGDDPEEELEALTGTIEIKAADDYGPFIEKAYTAELVDCNVSEALLKWEWYKAETPLWEQPELYPGANTQTYTPTSAEEFTVVARSVGVEGIKDGEIRAEIKIYAKPEYSYMLGTWKMVGADNNDWKPTPAPAGTVTDETMVIKWVDENKTSFRLDSTYDDEFLQFTITTWEKVTPPAIPGYQEIYKLTYTDATSKGYIYANQETPPVPRIFYLARKTTQGTPPKSIIDLWFQTGPTAGYEKNERDNGMARSYVKQ